ncbi:MAG: T9SS type A sorting domain-containing protein [Tannerella sp.]|jgi:hypothetical protein|nr:T9SS type A sorting domain-containing protein [Tannerella sp.]
MKTNITVLANRALACVAALSGTGFNAFAQGLTAVNDTLRTGPLQTVQKNIIRNDHIPGDGYEWRIITSPVTQGTVTKSGDMLAFTPHVQYRNTSFTLDYELSWGGVKDTAVIHITVDAYNNPVNVIYPDAQCVFEMPSGVTFQVHEKFKNTDVALDGFSMPLVGDINGDGKPDIIALGLGRSGNWTIGDDLSARAWYVHIFDGQTGRRLWSVNMGTEPASGALSNVTSLNHPGITSGVDEAGDQFQLRYDPRHNSPSHLAIADLDNDGLGEIVVVECGSAGRIYALKPVITLDKRAIAGFRVYWEGKNSSGALYSFKTPLTGNHEVFGAGVPYISDLNGDGVPEVIVYNKIFNGRTGQIICQLETLNNFGFPGASSITTIRNSYAYVGRRPGAAWRDDHIPCMVIADMNGDGILDIVAGSKVYLMKDSNGNPALDRIIHGPSRITVQRGTNSSNTAVTYVADGFTSVADIDLDGKLDVIVLAPAMNGLGDDTRNLLYVWDPMSARPDEVKAAVYLFTDSSTGTMSYPFVGDINGKADDYATAKNLPEICFNGGRFYTSHNDASQIAFHPWSRADFSSAEAVNGFNNSSSASVRGHIVAFTYHANPDGSTPLHQRLKLSWAMEHGDESSCTGITMFDFDNDNIKELCYRDETSVRVISPALKTYISNSTTSGAIRFKQSNIRSYTGFEAPVIADVDLDGSADIVTLAYPFSEPAGRSKGHIYVFEHASGYDKWAPCPPVWNQAIYFPLQINEDLTVPAKPQPMLTSYSDAAGHTVYPYNGQWIQQPITRAGDRYAPRVRQPDAILMDMTVSNTPSVVTLTIYNGGSASINSQTPIAFYDGGTDGKSIEGGAARIRLLPVGVDIFPGEKVTRTFPLSGNYNDHLVWARIVDDGTDFPADGYRECDLSNNTFSGSYCPRHVYTVKATTDTILCGTDETADTVRLTVSATQYTPVNPTYRWYRNNVEISGATSSTYATTLTGSYKCYVTDGICRGFSSNAVTLTRRADLPPKPAIRLAGTDLCVGDSIRLECSETGRNAYRWYRNGSLISGATQSVYWAKAPGGYTVSYLDAPCYSYLSDTATLFAFCAVTDTVVTSCETMPDTIHVLANDLLPADCTAPAVTIVSKPAHVTASVADGKIIYRSSRTGVDTLVYRITCDTLSAEGRVFVTVGARDASFVDDLWYFGLNQAGAADKSAGIRFVKDASGQYKPRDASGESNVYAQENSLVVSSPCSNGQNMLYASHNQLYNSLHDTLKHGVFSGHASVADGLAACYTGNNKYLVFAVSSCYDGSDCTERALKAYVIDMNADNGRGMKTAETTVEAAAQNMSESIELIACAGTTDKYWLVYPYRNVSDNSTHSNEMRVRLVDVSNPDRPSIGTGIHSSCGKTVAPTYSIVSSGQRNRIAVANSSGRTVDVFDFDNLTGKISLRSTASGMLGGSDTYGVAFSPDGNQLYVTAWNTAAARLYQYDVSAGNLAVPVDSIPYWDSQQTNSDKGGGLKSGPDGLIYVTQSYTNRVGAILNPDDHTPRSLSSRYKKEALTLSVHYTGLQFSAGLTRPAVMPCNLNSAPVARPDSAELCVSATARTAAINVLANDSDPENDTLFLTAASFVNSADTARAKLEINPADSTVILTLKPSAVMDAAGRIFDIVYDLKDAGLPVSQCATGLLRVKAYPEPALSSTLTPRSVCSGGTFSYTATSDATGVTFGWMRAAVAEITQPEGSGHTAVISETLTSTAASPVEVTYAVTLTTAHCSHTQEVKVWVFPGKPYTMRWMGLKDTAWHDPVNWVEVLTDNGRPYESPVWWLPSPCTDVVISSGMPHYPELTDSAWCRRITVQDRAMLKNPHMLNYDSARVELKLKATERERFIMWSAPLRDMYSGDYHFKDATSQPRWGDVYMNLFQQANPSGGTAAKNTFTATFGNPGVSLEPGKAFNLRVTGTSMSKDKTWIFPQPDTFYRDHNGVRYPMSGTLERDSSHRFITDGKTLDADTAFALNLPTNAGYDLVQTVNPYLAWLDMSKFLEGNKDRLSSGYLIWNGTFETGVNAVYIDRNRNDGNRYVYRTNPSLSPDNPNLIPPLQSFFVQKLDAGGSLASVRMSPNWTTTAADRPSYILRASAAENGVLRIRAVQGQRSSYALLRYDEHALTEYNGKEDIRTLFYDELPLTVCSFTPLREPLAINAGNSFDRQETALGLRVPEAGMAKLEFTGMETFGHRVYLIDRDRNGHRVDLQQTPEYTFTVTGPSGYSRGVIELNSRFVLQMEYTGDGLTDVTGPGGTEIRCSGFGAHIHVLVLSGTIRRLEVYNMPGSLVYAVGDGLPEYRIPAQTGVYIVKVQTGTGTVITEKVIVR